MQQIQDTMVLNKQAIGTFPTGKNQTAQSSGQDAA